MHLKKELCVVFKKSDITRLTFTDTIVVYEFSAVII